jgi:hypothetical protein
MLVVKTTYWQFYKTTFYGSTAKTILFAARKVEALFHDLIYGTQSDNGF